MGACYHVARTARPPGRRGALNKSNHLGNVLSVISDKRRRICEDGEYLLYRADILISSDYYPFGAPMPGRVWEKHVTDTFAVADTLRYYDFEGSTVTTSGIYEYVEEWRNDPGYTNLSVVTVSGTDWLRVTSTSCNHGTIQVFTDMLAGETYTVEYDVDIGTTSGVNLLWWTRVTGGGWTYRGVLQFSNTSGQRSVSFTVPTGADEVLMQFRQGNCGGPTYFMLDNIWIYDLNDQVVTFTPGGYRYGFNGMEKTDEWQGAGMEYTTEFRQYDPRLGRWMSLDPLMAQFPWQSPYVGMDNNPIYFADPFGLEGEDPISKQEKRRRAQIAKRNEREWKMQEKEFMENPMIRGQYNKICDCIPIVGDVNIYTQKPGKADRNYPWEITKDLNFSWFERLLMNTESGRGILFLNYLANKNPGGYTLTSRNTENTSKMRYEGDPYGEINVDDLLVPGGGGGDAPRRFFKHIKDDWARRLLYHYKKRSDAEDNVRSAYDNVTSSNNNVHGNKVDSIIFTYDKVEKFGPNTNHVPTIDTISESELDKWRSRASFKVIKKY